MAVFPMTRAPILCGALLLTLGACADVGFDFDMRSALGDALDTSDAALAVQTADRPRPDQRGVISYPGYQVAVAQRGDTARDVAARVDLPAEELARYNGMPVDLALRRGEIIALPRRVAEPSPVTGAVATGPVLPGGGAIATTPLGDEGIRSAGQAAPRTVPGGTEPTRHKVARGETAYSIARRYGVPVSALAEWNGLTGDLMIREGQFLLIPVTLSRGAPNSDATRPGSGSVAPVPPSAATPLPDEDATAAAPKETPPSPDLGGSASETSDTARFALPVAGPIIRGFNKGRNDGIDISANAGSPVRAADSGTVAAITRDTDQVPILVLRHSDNILTVYAGVDDVAVKKGDSVRRGQQIARIRSAAAPGLHFEVREGFDSVDPVPYLE